MAIMIAQTDIMLCWFNAIGTICNVISDAITDTLIHHTSTAVIALGWFAIAYIYCL